MANTTRHPSSVLSEKKECLLRQPNSVSGAGDSSFGSGEPAWEANTLPLSYTRENQSYFGCKKGGQKNANGAYNQIGDSKVRHWSALLSPDWHWLSAAQW